MGCAACMNKISDPMTAEQHRVKKLCNSLKPHSLVSEHERSEVVKLLNSGEHLKFPGPDPALPMFPLPEQRLQYWKVMILCRGTDLSKQPLDPSINKKHKCVEQIGLDIKRTFINKLQQKQQGILSRVLIKLASYIPHVGYTQGMNYVAGFFILCGFEEEEVFWLLVHLFITKDFLMIGMFEDEFPMTKIYMELFNRKLEITSPQLSAHLEKSNVPNEAWLFQWVLTWYLYNIPPEECVCIWEHIIRRGGLGVIAIAISIIMSIKDDLLANQPNYSIYSKLRSESLVAHINIKQILTNAEQIQINGNLIQDQSILSQKSRKYLKILTSSKEQPYKAFLDQIDNLRKSYFAAS